MGYLFVLSRLVRAESASEVTLGKKTGGMRDVRVTERQEQRGGNHTHTLLTESQ